MTREWAFVGLLVLIFAAVGVNADAIQTCASNVTTALVDCYAHNPIGTTCRVLNLTDSVNTTVYDCVRTLHPEMNIVTLQTFDIAIGLYSATPGPLNATFCLQDATELANVVCGTITCPNVVDYTSSFLNALSTYTNNGGFDGAQLPTTCAFDPVKQANVFPLSLDFNACLEDGAALLAGNCHNTTGLLRACCTARSDEFSGDPCSTYTNASTLTVDQVLAKAAVCSMSTLLIDFNQTVSSSPQIEAYASCVTSYEPMKTCLRSSFFYETKDLMTAIPECCTTCPNAVYSPSETVPYPSATLWALGGAYTSGLSFTLPSCNTTTGLYQSHTNTEIPVISPVVYGAFPAGIRNDMVGVSCLDATAADSNLDTLFSNGLADCNGVLPPAATPPAAPPATPPASPPASPPAKPPATPPTDPPATPPGELPCVEAVLQGMDQFYAPGNEIDISCANARNDSSIGFSAIDSYLLSLYPYLDADAMGGIWSVMKAYNTNGSTPLNVTFCTQDTVQIANVACGTLVCPNAAVDYIDTHNFPVVVDNVLRQVSAPLYYHLPYMCVFNVTQLQFNFPSSPKFVACMNDTASVLGSTNCHNYSALVRACCTAQSNATVLDTCPTFTNASEVTVNHVIAQAAVCSMSTSQIGFNELVSTSAQIEEYASCVTSYEPMKTCLRSTFFFNASFDIMSALPECCKQCPNAVYSPSQSVPYPSASLWALGGSYPEDLSFTQPSCNTTSGAYEVYTNAQVPVISPVTYGAFPAAIRNDMVGVTCDGTAANSDLITLFNNGYVDCIGVIPPASIPPPMSPPAKAPVSPPVSPPVSAPVSAPILAPTVTPSPPPIADAGIQPVVIVLVVVAVVVLAFVLVPIGIVRQRRSKSDSTSLRPIAIPQAQQQQQSRQEVKSPKKRQRLNVDL